MAPTPREEDLIADILDVYREPFELNMWDELSIIESLTVEVNRPLNETYIEAAIEAYTMVIDDSLTNEERGEWINYYRELMIELGWDEYDAHEWVDDLVSPTGSSA